MTTIKLPAPIEMTMPFVQVLGRRRSRREFSRDALDPALLSALLWACAGRNSADGRRTAPSALNCREVLCYVFDDKGVWLYHAEDHSLELIAEGDKRAHTSLAQDFVKTAPVTLLLAVDQSLAQPLSGSRTADICRSVDVGAMMQNALLACAAMGLAAVPRASLNAEDVLRAMGRTAAQLDPQIAVTVGFPA